MTSNSSCLEKQLSACWSSQNVCPIRSLGACSNTDASFARVREPVGEQRDDPFDAAVTARRHREPDWTQDGDLHAGSTTTRPSATAMFQEPPTALTLSRSRPSSQSGACSTLV